MHIEAIVNTDHLITLSYGHLVDTVRRMKYTGDKRHLLSISVYAPHSSHSSMRNGWASPHLLLHRTSSLEKDGFAEQATWMGKNMYPPQKNGWWDKILLRAENLQIKASLHHLHVDGVSRKTEKRPSVFSKQEALCSPHIYAWMMQLTVTAALLSTVCLAVEVNFCVTDFNRAVCDCWPL